MPGNKYVFKRVLEVSIVNDALLLKDRLLQPGIFGAKNYGEAGSSWSRGVKLISTDVTVALKGPDVT